MRNPLVSRDGAKNSVYMDNVILNLTKDHNVNLWGTSMKLTEIGLKFFNLSGCFN